MGVEDRLAELGIELPQPSEPAGNYVPATRTGDLLFLAGHGPRRADGTLVQGKLGADLDVDAGREAARLTALAMLGTVRRELGSLDHVRRIVRVFGMVNCTPDFTRMPEVVDGCSDLLVDVFGEAGRHARAAVGMASLPRGIAVEIDMVVEVG